jgi:hypothetical protein
LSVAIGAGQISPPIRARGESGRFLEKAAQKLLVFGLGRSQARAGNNLGLLGSRSGTTFHA